jgi:NAD+ kinase
MGRPNRQNREGDKVKILIVSHTRRDETVQAGLYVCEQLINSGITPVMTAADISEYCRVVESQGAPSSVIASVEEFNFDPAKLELVIVLGGDGTILKAAEIVRTAAVPLLGINLGHVGFLAETEREELAEAVARVIAKDFVIEERTTLDVVVSVEGREVYRTWALNEATVEKSARERMLEVVIEVEGQPLSSFGCDGIVVSTPTGSTAYAFSAGGPVVWPSVDALLLVPLSAHALFARPLVVPPESLMAIEVLQRSAGTGVLWCDGRRSSELPLGARVEITRSYLPVRLARLHPITFTERLVSKFALPVTGWRGNSAAERA